MHLDRIRCVRLDVRNPILRLAISLLVLVSLIGPPVAAAPSGAGEPPVDEMYRAGIDLRRHGDDRGALAQFQKSYGANPTPRTLAQIGLAEQALGRWVDAEVHLAEAMKATGNPWIAKNRDTLEPALAVITSHLGSIAVEGPPGAVIDVNGAHGGTLPLEHPLRVPAGTVVLGVRAPGYVPMQRIATVAVGQLAREQIDLVPLSQSPPGSPLPTPAVPTNSGAGEGERPAPPPAPASPGLWHRRAGWVTAGLGAVALVTGATFHLVHENKLSSYNRKDASGANVCNRDSAGHFYGPADCADDYNGAATARTGLIVGYTAAVVFGGAAVALFLTAPAEQPASAAAAGDGGRRARLALECGPVPGQWGLACGGAF
jgi:hypothetical protein